jgi:hypothetical protein
MRRALRFASCVLFMLCLMIESVHRVIRTSMIEEGADV